MTRPLSFVIGCLALAVSVAYGQDAVKTKLDAAKQAYKIAEVEQRQAVGTWLDKRDETARKDGNKRLVDLIKTERKAYDEKGEIPKGAPKTILEKIGPARAAMEAAYREAVKEYTKARMDKEAEAVEKEWKEFLKGKPAGVKGVVPTITPAMLKAKLAGRASYDQKTGVLTLTYRFGNKDELKDFDLGSAKPVLSPSGALGILPDESVKHVVVFDTVAITTVLGVKQMKGTILTTTDGVHVAVGGANPDTLYMDVKNAGGQSVIVPGNVRSGNVRFGLAVTDEKVTVQYATDILARKPPQPVAGQIVLHGGELGFAFASLTIAGKVNPDWAATFFAE